ncbi:methionine synthase [Thermoleptolyngbya sichuanensis XZ-Cy5]|uniref:Npun_R2821/Npun_R2822 family protein n=1 Tax=Thermoleptolyngbya sichuanensis TaxID=2885951 RepID=UPI00240D28DE|nr:Npun_R2821/Npun_R2822 family protein [Thermoleptolyngbya sichuanensis]MDG2617125.1 methionine synthase [Thermoleptolyngbya sichuanensis XZ-Cy5]
MNKPKEQDQDHQDQVYILGNDRVLDQAIALLNSIRLYDPETPVVLIPYNDKYKEAAAVLGDRFGVTLFPDLTILEWLDATIEETFGSDFFTRPQQFRKQAAWFGKPGRFLYIDTDIVVFERIIAVLEHLQTYDFICCDYQHRGSIQNVFTPAILEAPGFSESVLAEIFNCGFWGSKTGLISASDLEAVFAECAAHPDYFDFSQKTSDQPIINYLVLKQISNRFNLVHRSGGAPGNWAGSKFRQRDWRLFDPNMNQPLQYLHWAGFRLQPGCPYWALWQHYRDLNDWNESKLRSPRSPKFRFRLPWQS